MPASIEKENILGELSKNEYKNKGVEKGIEKLRLTSDDRVLEKAPNGNKYIFDPALEPLLKENKERFVIFPIKYHGK